MALTYSNKVAQSTPALSNALSSKLDTDPMKKLQLPYQKVPAKPIAPIKASPVAQIAQPTPAPIVKASTPTYPPPAPVTPAPQENIASPIAPLAKIPQRDISYKGAVGDAQDALRRSQEFNQALQQGMNDITQKPIGLRFQQGQQAALQRDYGVQQQALAQQGQNAISIAGLAAPQQYGLTTQPYLPTEDRYGGDGASGAINRGIQASNIGTAQDFQSKIQQTQAQQTSAENNLNLLKSIAQQGGVASNAPILSTLRQILGQTVGGGDSPQVVAFLTQLKGLNDAYSSLTGQTIPENVSLDQLQGIQQSLKGTTQNKIYGFQNQLSQLTQGASGGNNGNGAGGNNNDPLGLFQ